MAERMSYEVPPTRTEPTAAEAMQKLIESLHQHGFLRLATDVVNANTQIAKVLVDGLNQPGSLNAMQNLTLLFKALATIPPEDFNPLLLAVTAAAKGMRENAHAPADKGAPGIRGIIKMLNDEELWQGVKPVMAGMRAFGREINKPAEKPISRYSGKPSHA